MATKPKTAAARAASRAKERQSTLTDTEKKQRELERKEAAAKAKAAEIAEQKKKIAEEAKAEKERLRAEADAVKAAKKAAREEAKAAKAAEQEKVKEGLQPAAKEINYRLTEAQKIIGKADDHRLAAALKLAEVRQACIDAGLSFKNWIDESITVPYQKTELYSLSTIGMTEDPPAALLEWRQGNADRVRAFRERQKAEREAARALLADQRPKPEEPEEESGGEEVAKPGRAGKGEAQAPDLPKGKSAPAESAFIVAERAITSIKDDSERRNAARSFAEREGLAVVEKEMAATARKLAGRNIDALKDVFKSYTLSDRVAFLEWATAELGYQLVDPTEASAGEERPKGDNEPAGDPLEIPAALDRRGKKGGLAAKIVETADD